MKNFKKEFQNDFNNAAKTPDFDVSSLDMSVRAKKKITPFSIIIRVVSLGLVAAVVIPVSIAAVKLFNDEFSSEKFSLTRKTVSKTQLDIANLNSFKSLNSVNYPDASTKQYLNYADDDFIAYDHFAYSTMSNINFGENYSFSPLTLYGCMNNLSLASSRGDLDNRFDALFGMNKTQRRTFYHKVFNNNYYNINEIGTSLLNNAAFLTNAFEINDEYVDELAAFYTEAYSLDFTKDDDVNQMLKWVKEALRDNKLLTKDDLNVSKETALVTMSTMYSNFGWQTKFTNVNNTKEKFYLLNGSDVTSEFMNHSYRVFNYYDYGDYISVTDKYFAGNTITYITPKEIDGNIHELLRNVNFLKEDDNKKVSPNGYDFLVELSVPKIDMEYKLDLMNMVKKLGFEDMTDKAYNSLSRPFKNCTSNIFLNNLFQKNKVAFNEDGTIIKSVTVSIGNGAVAYRPPTKDVLRVNLNSPFIYVIKDSGGLPIFVGSVDNPTRK